MRRSVQFVASDSRMIVYRPADGQSPAIRNDNLQFSVTCKHQRRRKYNDNLEKMIRISLIMGFQIFMIALILIIMRFAYSQGENELLYLGLGIPLFVYFLFAYSKWLNRVEVNQDNFKIKNIFWGKKTIKYPDIDWWTINQTIHVSQKNLLIKANKKKIVISNLIDNEDYEYLCLKLETHCSEKNETLN